VPEATFNAHFSFALRWERLKNAALILIDEVAMAPSTIFTILDNVLRRIYDAHASTDPMFAGQVLLFGGDLRQLGPIPSDGQTQEQLHFRNSPSFAEAKIFSLTVNKRTDESETDFAEFLQEVGEGRTKQFLGLPKDSVVIDPDMVITNFKLEKLIDWTFGDDPSTSGAMSAILTPFNMDCFKINKLIVDDLPGNLYTCLSEDSIVDDSSSNRLLAAGARPTVGEVPEPTARRLVHQDELHLILETGMPPHKLELKIGAIVNLIKNLDVKSGLVNGCRLRVTKVSRDRLDAEIISEFPNLKESHVSLPRVRFLKECGHALVMQRIQFPVRLGFACTINKSQGLTLDKVSSHVHFN